MAAKGVKSGFVAIVGKPNVGKSTVLNWFFNKKIAIVSSKPETTRDNIRGILTAKEAQIVFVDTPGIHKAHFRLGKEMVRKAKSSLYEADIILAVIDAASGIDRDDEMLLGLIRESKIPALALLNKVDIMKKSKLLPMIDNLSKTYSFLEIMPISALRGDNMDVLKNKIIKYLPKGEKYYPDEQIIDKDINFRISEIIREKALDLTRQEVPHAIAVFIDDMRPAENKNTTYIKAYIYVERESQKAIVVGRNGDMIKRIGILAREEIEKMLNKSIFLDVWVKVLKDWRNDPRALKMLGLQ